MRAPGRVVPGVRNVAVTFDAALTEQEGALPELVQSMPQPAKVEGAFGFSDRVTICPAGKLAEHVPEITPAAMLQSMPAGTETTSPVPVPWSVTVTVYGGAADAKFAVTPVAADTNTMQIWFVP